jgi:hypothetical protein
MENSLFLLFLVGIYFFWILLKPLPVGNHQIQFSGSVVDFTATGPSNFVSDAKYDITITMSILLLPDPSLE